MTNAPQSAILHGGGSVGDVLLIWTGTTDGSAVIGPGTPVLFPGAGLWTLTINGPRDMVGVNLAAAAGGAGGGSVEFGGGGGGGASSDGIANTHNMRPGRTYTLRIGVGGVAGEPLVDLGNGYGFGTNGGETYLYDNLTGTYVFRFSGGNVNTVGGVVVAGVGVSGGAGAWPGDKYIDGGAGSASGTSTGGGGGGGGTGDSDVPGGPAAGGAGGPGGGLNNGGANGFGAFYPTSGDTAGGSIPSPGAQTPGGDTAQAQGGRVGYHSGGGGAGRGANGTAFGGGGGGAGLGTGQPGGYGAQGYFRLTRKVDGGAY